MTAENSVNEKNGDHKSSLPRKLLFNVVIPSLAVSVIVLMIEYWSGLFAQTSRLSIATPISLGRILFVVLVITISILFAIDSLRIWFQQRKYLREDYAATGFLTITFLMLTLMMILLTNLMPWNIGTALTQIFSGNQVSVPETRFADYGFLIMLYLVTTVLILRGHQHWEGKKSLNQYNLEQRGESISIFKEALQEFHRIVRRAPPLSSYQEASRNQYITQLEPVADSLAWRDQARELLRLSSSSYAFDPVEDWHDKSGCWLGSNINTGNMVGLYPAQWCIDDAEIEDFVSYVRQVATDQHRRIDELVVAVQGDSAPKVKRWRGKKTRLETEASLLDNLVDFTDYENEIRKRVLVNHLQYSELTLNDVYVPSRFFLTTSDEKPSDNVGENLYEWLKEPGYRQLALLGEYGQGKSTAALMLTYHLLFEKEHGPSRIPILIELRGRSPRNQTPLGLLGDWASRYRIEPQALMRLLIAGRLLLILEGFDEMALVGDAEIRLRHFKTLWQFCYPRAKILITGRPNFFLDEEELKAALGISKPISDQPYCEALRLAPFDLSQMQEALRKHKPLVRNQICELARHNKRFRELVARPSLLHIVSVLWEREELAEEVEKLNSAYVMDLFIRHSYRRQGLKEADAPGFMALTTLEREYFMRGIASYMAANSLPNQISGSQLSEAIEALLEKIPDAVSTESSAISGEISRPLRLRIAETQHGVERVKTDVRACGILVDDPASPGTFHFGHKSFMEYLFAAVLAEFINEETPASARAILEATGAAIEDILTLPVSVGFLAELVEASIQSQPYKNSLSEGSERLIAERTFAGRLLRVISGGGNLSFVTQRLVLLDEAFTRSAAHMSRVRRFIVILLSPSSVLALTVMLWMGFLSLGLWSSDFALSGTEHRSLPLLLMAVFAPFVAMLLMWPLFRRRLEVAAARVLASKGGVIVGGKLELWNDICKKVNIQDRVLHRIAGTWWLPWAKGQPFDYFLPQPDSDELTDTQGE